jgi:hypothetical protein
MFKSKIFGLFKYAKKDFIQYDLFWIIDDN